jgi:hypothetical protein
MMSMSGRMLFFLHISFHDCVYERTFRVTLAGGVFLQDIELCAFSPPRQHQTYPAFTRRRLVDQEIITKR